MIPARCPFLAVLIARVVAQVESGIMQVGEWARFSNGDIASSIRILVG